MKSGEHRYLTDRLANLKDAASKISDGQIRKLVGMEVGEVLGLLDREIDNVNELLSQKEVA